MSRWICPREKVNFKNSKENTVMEPKPKKTWEKHYFQKKNL